MRDRTNLTLAKKAKNDEFYTQYEDVEAEMNAYLECNPKLFRNKVVLCPCDDPEWSNFTRYFSQNFERLGLKKFISTSYAPTRAAGHHGQPTLFETSSDKYDEALSNTRGRIFTLERDKTGDGRTDFHDIEWDYLDGDGDFRSDEVCSLRDKADIIITNPPFSLFREFLAWILEATKPKQFALIGNMNAITYKEVFPLLQKDKMWLGTSNPKHFRDGTYTQDATLKAFGNICWYANIAHGRRNQPLSLMTKADNIRFSKHKEVRDLGYQKYDNYDAIEVPYTDAIPSDHEGVMGVPITFLGKYCPDQFEIVGATQRGCHDLVPDLKKYDDYKEMRPDGTPTGSSGGKTNENANLKGNDGKKNYFINKNGHVVQSTYQRLFIKHRSTTK